MAAAGSASSSRPRAFAYDDVVSQREQLQRVTQRLKNTEGLLERLIASHRTIRAQRDEAIATAQRLEELIAENQRSLADAAASQERVQEQLQIQIEHSRREQEANKYSFIGIGAGAGLGGVLGALAAAVMRLNPLAMILSGVFFGGAAGGWAGHKYGHRQN